MPGRNPDELDRREGGTAEEIVGRGPVGKPNRGGTRRHYAQCGDREGAPSRPVRSRKARSGGHVLRVPRHSVRGNTALAYDYEADFEPDLVEIPITQRKTLLELNDRTCHWPIGDPGSAEFFFCGGETVNELPYCAYHARVAYQPAHERRRDRRLAKGS